MFRIREVGQRCYTVALLRRVRKGYATCKCYRRFYLYADDDSRAVEKYVDFVRGSSYHSALVEPSGNVIASSNNGVCRPVSWAAWVVLGGDSWQGEPRRRSEPLSLDANVYL